MDLDLSLKKMLDEETKKDKYNQPNGTPKQISQKQLKSVAVKKISCKIPEKSTKNG